jgi:hypothetical protein
MTVITANPETSISRKISRAKITKTTCVEVDYDQTITIQQADSEKPLELSGECPYKGRNIAHQDLIDAFRLLHPHFAILCDLKEVNNMTLHELENNLNKIDNIGVRSFSIGGSGDNEGVTLSGFKKIGNKMINLNTPFTKFDDENDPYTNMVELQHVINVIIEEVELYLDGKVAPDAQMSMDFGDEEEDDQSY